MREKIKLIVTDLDRTLLKEDKTISEYTIKTIERLMQRNIVFAVATARPIRAVKGMIDNLVYDASIYHNGAVVLFGKNKLSHICIEKKDALAIIHKMVKVVSNIRVAVEINDHLYANFDPTGIWKGIDYTYEDFSSELPGDVDKMIIDINSVSNLDSLLSCITDDLYIEESENRIGMIMKKDATKEAGIKQICDHLKIDIKNVLVFGDDYNDIGMVKKCGIGVAVDNAIPEVKEVADYICESNENDGVAKWIQTNVL